MNFYFSTRHIPALKGLPLAERVKRLDQAAKKLTVPEKTLLNVLKLLVIVPVFVLILQTASNWTSLLWALLVFLLYPFLLDLEGQLFSYTLFYLFLILKSKNYYYLKLLRIL